MSARKAEISSTFHPLTLHGKEARLALSSDSVVFHKSGIEFRSSTPFSPWTEMTLVMQSPEGHSRIQCNGVVIFCTGNKHTGYHVSMLFTSMSKHAEERLSSMAARA
jgi:hypothetical protein